MVSPEVLVERLLFIEGWVRTAGLDGIVPGLGVTCAGAPASPGVVGGLGVVVCATARPIEPTTAKAVREEMRRFDLFMVKFR